MMTTPFVSWPEDMKLVLASRSPRRAELLQVAGIPFVIEPAPDVEAELAATLTDLHPYPHQYAMTLAAAKAQAVAEKDTTRLVLGSDTIVVIDGDILEKPVDVEDAVALLSRLSGRKHVVISAIALCGASAGMPGLQAYEETEVEFLPLDDNSIRRYVATGEPMDKAGAYGIQGYGALMVRGVHGCYFNVMGLPLSLLGETLRSILSAPLK